MKGKVVRKSATLFESLPVVCKIYGVEERKNGAPSLI
jgi:hypothetical protein